MNLNHENNQFGPGSKIDKKQGENDDDFLSGDNKAIYHPNLDQYEVSTEDEDRYNNGNSEHDEFIDNVVSEEETKTRYSSPSRNGSHRNH
ncbi:MAG: hypothetical protein M0D53_17235 [Flavobacterium sp. JAD_PAG50586_2]|nr:MAG: hypothetical protein M0D53_17235 [Flavobacterium sp. JAD_PAG50586_2]